MQLAIDGKRSIRWIEKGARKGGVACGRWNCRQFPRHDATERASSKMQKLAKNFLYPTSTLYTAKRKWRNLKSLIYLREFLIIEKYVELGKPFWKPFSRYYYVFSF